MNDVLKDKNDFILDPKIPRYENLKIFSTDEKKIGKWVDGKPLYRKVFIVTDQNNINFDVSDLNIDTCCKIECTIDYISTASYENHYIRPLYALNDAEYFVVFLRDNTIQTRISEYLASMIATFNKIIYVLKYTKTTDSI